jgi:probable F420-dependent oxidoreductase
MVGDASEQAVRFGLTTPVVTLAPRAHSRWEVDGGPIELRQIAQAADRLGYHHLTCSEHVGIPTTAAAARGTRYYDPAATLAWMAALTTRIRLVTHVIVLPYHHPLAVAKRYGTLDRLSGGRLILGVGVGSLREEFELLGVDFDARGPRYEDALRALRSALSSARPSYRGAHYAFADFVIDPCGVQQPPPIWIGGRSARSLRRALLHGDGWDPFGLDLRQLAGIIARAKESAAWQARRRPFEIVLSLERLFDVRETEQREKLRALIGEYRRIGATLMSLRFQHESAAHYLEQIEIFAAQVAPAFADDPGVAGGAQ